MAVNYFLSAVVILYFSTTVIEVLGQNGKCPDGTFEASNHACFKFVNNYTTFSDAEHSCISMGGHLAAINSSFVNSFIAQNASNIFTDDYWIGAYVYTRIACKPWVWTSNNELVLYTDWASGQPGGETNGGECASASIFDGTWSAADCSSTKPYVCIVPRIAYNCPSEWIYFEESKSCYKIFYWATWEDAKNVCVDNGAHLASIHSDAENNFVVSISHDGNSHSNDWTHLTWIGLFTTTNDNSVWQWSDGSPVNYITWTPGEPNNPGIEKCVELSYDFADTAHNNHWDNNACDTNMRNYVCKKPATVLNLN